jgi:hypothetical protein
MSDATSMLRRLQTTAAVCCAAMTIAALVLARGQLRPALGVLGGGVLAGVSLLSIRSGVGGMIVGTASDTRPRVAWMVVKIAGRYALLAILAYVMIARLRLHPLGLLAGASSVVAAAVIEAGRLLSTKK